MSSSAVRTDRAIAPESERLVEVGAGPDGMADFGPVRDDDSSLPAVEVRDASKCYHVYRKPVDRLKQAMFRHKKKFYREFWALTGVSFDLARGGSLGVVGRNGAGKSTLLQIIAGTLAPTAGEVRVRGRVGALLELGTGFNPEFTGRENAFLNASINGVPAKQLRERFDQIERFAEIGEFIDRPIKTYSTGMRARLAFAVTTALEPEILILDEILAVGDIGFQQKCATRLKTLRDSGLTLLFVSHSPGTVSTVCEQAIYLRDGRLVMFGPASTVTDTYQKHVREGLNEQMSPDSGLDEAVVEPKVHVPGTIRYGTGHVQLEAVEIADTAGEPATSFTARDEALVTMRLRAHRPADRVSVSLVVRDSRGVHVLGLTTFDEGVELPDLQPGEAVTLRFRFALNVGPGKFGLCIAISRIGDADRSNVVLLDQVNGCAPFSVGQNAQRPIWHKAWEPTEIEWSRDA